MNDKSRKTKELWGRSNQDQRMEMIKATVNDCFENVSLRDKINIWFTRPGRGNFLPWACLSFPTTELKYSYENFVKEKRNRIAAYRADKSTSLHKDWFLRTFCQQKLR